MKKPLIASGIVAAILVLLALVGPSFVDWTKYRTELSDVVYQFTGREVAIGGDLTFRILPTPALTARDIRLANVEGGIGENFLELDGLDVKLDLFALLVGKIEVTSIVLERPHLTLEQDAEGRTNWEFTPEGEPAADEGDEDAGGLRFHRFAIQDGTVNYYDAASGRREEATSISASIRADTERGPFAVDGGLVYRNVTVMIDAMTGQITAGEPISLRAKLILDGQSPGLTFTGTVDSGEKTEPASSVNGQINGQIKGGGQNFGTFVEALAKMSGESFNAPVRLDQIFEIDTKVAASDKGGSISNLSFRIGSTTAEGEIAYAMDDVKTADVRLEVNTVRLEDWLLTSGVRKAADPGSASANGFALPADAEVKANISVGAVEYNDAVVRQVSLEGGLSAGQITINDLRALMPGGSDVVLTGVVSAPDNQPVFEGRVRAGSNNLRALLGWLDVDTTSVPDGQLATFSLDGGLRATPEVVQIFDARTALDISKADGGFGIGFGQRPSYTVDLIVDRMNFDAYSTPGPSGSTAAQDWPAKKQAIIDALAPLGGFDASIKLNVAQLTAAEANISGLQIEGTLTNGALSLTRFSAASLEAVRLDVRGRLAGLGGSPSFDLAVDLETPNAGRMMRWLDASEEIAPDALAKIALTGSVSGTLDNVNVDLTGAALGGTYTLAGGLSGLSPMPGAVNVTFDLAHPDHHDLSDRLAMDLGLVGAAQPVRISGEARGALDDLIGKVTVEAIGGSLQADGRVAGPNENRSFDLALQLRHGDLTGLVRTLGQDYKPSVAQLGPVDVSVRVTGTAKTFAVSDLVADLGPSIFSGDLKIDHVGERLTVTGAITTGQVAIDTYLPTPVAGAQQAASAGGQRWSKRPLELEPLRDFDVDVELRAEAVINSPYRLEGLQTTIKLKDGVLSLPNFRARMFNGVLRLGLFLDISNIPALNLDLDIQRVEAAGLLQAAAFVGPLAGRMDVKGRFTAEGNNQLAMISTLNGSTDVIIDQGRFLGLAVPLLYGSVARQCNPLNVATLISNALGAGETQFQSIATQVIIENGVARYADVNAAVNAINLTSQGEVNLPEWTIAINGEMTSRDLPDAPPITYDYSGDIDNPKKTFQTAALKSYMDERAAALQASGTAECAVGGGAADPLSQLLRGVLPGQPSDPSGETAAPRSKEEQVIDVIGGLFRKKRPPEEAEKEGEEADPEEPPR